ncbi:MAG: protein-disulfide reductase DsbD [Pontibacterium sp.]
MIRVLKFSSIVVLLFQCLLLTGQSAHAGLFDKGNPFSSSANDPVPVEQAFVFNFAQEGSQLVLSWTMPDDYYLYRDRMTFKVSDNIEIAERVNATADPKDDPLFGKVWVYHNQAQVDLTLSSLTDQASDGTLTVTYQGCWEGGICYPPVTKTVDLSAIQKFVPVAVSAPVSQRAETDQTTPDTTVQPVLSEQDKFARLLSGENLLFTLGAFFLAGLALSFTPCVFPMIPILSSIIAGQGRHITTGRAFTLSAVYVLAVALTYTVAGVLAGLFGENLQAAFQNPWIISTFSALFVVLALSMFGFYELQLPGSWQTRLSALSGKQAGGTLGGVVVMGLLSALIVGPCMAAPLAGALIYIGESGDPLLGGLALFSLSLGMGVPLLLVGISAGKLLPKAGVWMESVKAGFGVMLLLLAIWMLDRIVPTEATMLLTAGVLIGSAIFMHALDRLPEPANSGSRLWKGVGVIMLIYGSALLIGALSGNRSMLYPLQGTGFSGNPVSASTALPFQKVTTPEQLDQLLLSAQENKQPVMLDFYADWCISCIELETYTFADPGVQQALKGFLLIKVDVTANDENAKMLNKAYGVVGPPALIFYDQKGQIHKNMTLIGVSDPEDFVAHLLRLRT